MKKITYKLNVEVAEGPKLGITQSLDVEAYDVINIDVDPGGTPDVDVAQGNVQFLLISLAQPYPTEHPLTYKVKGQADTFTLDAPHLLLGGGVKDLLGKLPEVLQFANDGNNPKLTVQILVGRDATP
jgi:hypothetical protein